MEEFRNWRFLESDCKMDLSKLFFILEFSRYEERLEQDPEEAIWPIKFPWILLRESVIAWSLWLSCLKIDYDLTSILFDLVSRLLLEDIPCVALSCIFSLYLDLGSASEDSDSNWAMLTNGFWLISLILSANLFYSKLMSFPRIKSSNTL